MSFTIYGHSDDLVEVEGPGGDEISCYDAGVNIVIGQAEAVEGQDAYGIRVKMRYGKGGVWAATLEPIAEDVVCMYPITVGVAGYSAVVNVECPDGTPVSWKKTRVKR